MAERKVSSKNKNELFKKVRKEISPEEKAYDDFLAQNVPELRKRSTKTVSKPKKNMPDDNSAANCGEIDPHTTTNPVIQRQIMTKRTGRVLNDDTGFKAMSYNQRFELQPEMPDIQIDQNTDVINEGNGDNIPGQQTMADVASQYDSVNIHVPIEQEIDTAADPFADAYKSLRKDEPISFGRSEKLRAIARTAADDAEMEPDSQLAFPSFDPLFKFPENNKKQDGKLKKSLNQIKEKKKKTKKASQETPESNDFDIEEKDIIAAGRTDETDAEMTEQVITEPTDENEKKPNKSRIFELLNNSRDDEDEAPPFEISSRSDIKPTFEKISKIKLSKLIRSGIILAVSLVLFIISTIFDISESAHSAVYLTVCLMFILAAAFISAKEIYEGVKDITHFSFSHNAGCVLILVSALIQNIAAFFAGDSIIGSIHILAPAAIFSLLCTIVPGIILSDNSLTVIKTMTGSRSLAVFKAASESGVEGSMKERFADKNTDLRYSCNTSLLTGLMKKLTNPLPNAFGIGSVYILAVFFSVIVGIACGIIGGNAISGVTAFTGMIITCVPVSYAITAAVLLLKHNKELAQKGSSLISYGTAEQLMNTSAVVVSADDIIEKKSCSIHGIKPFGRKDPKTVTLYAASLINAVDSPLTEFMKQVTEQSGEEVPEARDVQIITGKGAAATVENSRVLMGTKDFLIENGIAMPDEDLEEKFITGDRKLLYIAVGSEFSMLFTVSYHIKRNISSFFKYLQKMNIKVVINSTDPNISASYIKKKCKLKEDFAAETDDIQSAYLKEKAERTESAMPADAFTDGKTSSLSSLITSAVRLKKCASVIPLIIYALAAAGAIFIAVPALTGSVHIISNIYIIMIKLISVAAGILIPVFAIK